MRHHLRRAWGSGSTGWALLATGVFAWNAAHSREGEMLSTAFARGLDHATARWFVLFVWTTLTLHLFDVLPDAIDPFGRLADAFERRLNAQVSA